jgi:transposase
MISGIFFILRTGVPWRDLPREFGPWNSVYTRFRRWCRSELWSKILALVSADTCDSIRSVDCTHIKVHQDASNAAGGAVAQAIGRTKGGPNTKLAAVVDGLGRATGLSLAPGNRNDLRAVATLINHMADCWVIGDRAFDAGTFRRELLAADSRPCIPPRCSSKIQHYYSELLYAHRHVVENFFACIKRMRRVGTRYEKLGETFLGFVSFAAVLDWLHFEV